MEGREICAPATERDTGERSKNEGNTVVHPYVAAGAEGRGVRLQGATRSGGRVSLGLLQACVAGVFKGSHQEAQGEGWGLTLTPSHYEEEKPQALNACGFSSFICSASASASPAPLASFASATLLRRCSRYGAGSVQLVGWPLAWCRSTRRSPCTS